MSEKPVKCKFFEVREFLNIETTGVMRKSFPEEFNSETGVEGAIEEFLKDKEFVRSDQCTITVGTFKNPLLITKITTFYRDKK